MIALKANPQPNEQLRVHVRAREAARRRGRRTRMRGYAMPVRIVLAFAIALVPLMTYVLLMGNLTALNFTLAKVTQQKVALVDETMRLDDRIAQLRSRERLSVVASRLHMRDPREYAVIDVPAPVAAPPVTGIAFLGALFHR